MRRIKYLTLMQIGDGLRDLMSENKKKLVGRILLRVLLIGIVTAVMVALFWLLGNFFQLFPSQDMFVTILFVTQLIGIASCLGGMTLVLFASKENTMLLAFPCKYSEIFVSKIVVFALDEIKKNLYFLLPLLIGFGVNANVGFAYWIQLPLFW